MLKYMVSHALRYAEIIVSHVLRYAEIYTCSLLVHSVMLIYLFSPVILCAEKSVSFCITLCRYI